MGALYLGGQRVTPAITKTVGDINNQNKTITANGTYSADAGYTGLGTVTVAVPGAASGTYSISSNGTYNISNYEYVDVNVSGGGGGGDYSPRDSVVSIHIAQNVAGGAYSQDMLEDLIDVSGIMRNGKGSVNIEISDVGTFSGIDFGVLNGATFETLSIAGDTNAALAPVAKYAQFTNIDVNHCPTWSWMSVLNQPLVNCSGVELITIAGIETIGPYSMKFTNDAELTAINIEFADPATASIDVDGFVGALAGCASLYEIHFPAGVQAQIEATTDYATKWGAPYPDNVNIFFD